jgi:ribA/ribD-fused uncharacterized protein
MKKIDEITEESIREYWIKTAEKKGQEKGFTINDLRFYDEEVVWFNCQNKPNRELSNFYQCELNYQGLRFNSSEQLYYWFATSETPEQRALVMNQPNAASVKKLKVTKDSDWFNKRIRYMRICIQTKYEECEAFRNKLLSTGNKPILEFAYWWDLYWGCVKKDNYYVGVNALGRLLMELREKHLH